MKKILLYTDTPQTGGAELQIFLLAKFLDKTQFEPILACSNFPILDKWCEKFRKENIQVFRLNVKHKHDPRHYFQLKKILKENQIDLLHLHLWNPASCRYGFRAGISLKIPIITTEHDPFELSWLKNVYKKKALKKVSKIIAISHDNQKQLEKLYHEHQNKIKTIHNGIDINWWQSQLLGYKVSNHWRTKEEIFKAKKSTLIITTIAELHERKGLKYLIEAIPEVVEKFSNVKFVIIGEGGERKNLENLAEKLKLQNHLIFLGRQKEIPKLLESSEIFVLPSIREGFGLVNCEAMISGLPVIASNIGGIAEIVKDGETGILVPAQNPQALAESLIELIENPEKRQKFGQAGRRQVIENFDAKKMAEQYGKVYQEMLRANTF